MNAIERLKRYVASIAGAGRIKQVDDSGVVQVLQVYRGPLETQDKMPWIGSYGLAANPPLDSDCLMLFFGGDRNNGVVVGTNDPKSRLTGLQPGEVALYNKFGAKIVLKANGDIEVTSPTKVKFIVPQAEFTGDVLVDGTLTATTDVIGGGKHLKTHTHSGVQAGGANTGPPT